MSNEVDVIQYDEIKKVWQQVSRHASNKELSFELEIHKKLLNIFQVGEQYYYIFNLATAQIEMVSDSVNTVLGLKAKTDFTTDYVLQNIHPDDLPTFGAFERRAGEFYNQLPADKIFKYKMSYDYRLMRQEGQYIRILQQVVPIQASDNGEVIRTLGVHTNISHLKKDTTMSLSMMGLDGEPDFTNLLTQQPGQLANWPFTRQEKTILNLLIEGKNSRQIAEQLNLSKLTVDTHRRNMLQKTNARSISELTLKYIQSKRD